MKQIRLNAPRTSFYLPWFMFDISNKQLITSVTIPGDITDRKNIILTETPIPGKNFQPVQYGGGGNRKIGFTLPVINRNNTVGDILLVKQFDNLRNQAVGLTGIFSGQFTPNPKVLYYWGTGSVPLEYWVSKCDFVHPGGWVNEMGAPKYTLIEIELILNETNFLYKAEEVYRKLASLAGMVINSYNIIQSNITGRRPY